MNPSTSTCLTNKCRFCYNYNPPGFIDPCCLPKVCATNSYLSTISSLPISCSINVFFNYDIKVIQKT